MSLSIIHKAYRNQTGTIGPFTLLAASVDTDVIVGAYVENLTATSSVQATFTWTDDLGSQSWSFLAENMGAGGTNVPRLLHLKAGTSLSFSLTDSGNSQTYNAYVFGGGEPTP